MRVEELRQLLDEVRLEPDQPVYVIGVACRLVRLPIWTLRVLDKEGVVKPRRRAGRARLYSLTDIWRLMKVRKLMKEQGVNVDGVRVILRMQTMAITRR